MSINFTSILRSVVVLTCVKKKSAAEGKN